MASKTEDHWSSKVRENYVVKNRNPPPTDDEQAYQNSASFVPKLATKILGWLDVQKDDVILDVGCGGKCDFVCLICRVLLVSYVWKNCCILLRDYTSKSLVGNGSEESVY